MSSALAARRRLSGLWVAGVVARLWLVVLVVVAAIHLRVLPASPEGRALAARLVHVLSLSLWPSR